MTDKMYTNSDRFKCIYCTLLLGKWHRKINVLPLLNMSHSLFFRQAVDRGRREERLASASGLHVLKHGPLPGRVWVAVGRAALEGRRVVVVVVVDGDARFHLCDTDKRRMRRWKRHGKQSHRKPSSTPTSAPHPQPPPLPHF